MLDSEKVTHLQKFILTFSLVYKGTNPSFRQRRFPDYSPLNSTAQKAGVIRITALSISFLSLDINTISDSKKSQFEHIYEKLPTTSWHIGNSEMSHYS